MGGEIIAVYFITYTPKWFLSFLANAYHTEDNLNDCHCLLEMRIRWIYILYLQVDIEYMQSLRAIRDIDQDGVTEDTFHDVSVFEFWHNYH